LPGPAAARAFAFDEPNYQACDVLVQAHARVHLELADLAELRVLQRSGTSGRGNLDGRQEFVSVQERPR
jgi:hypothetical protein